MRIEIHADKQRYKQGEHVRLRVIAYNDSFEPVELDRTTLYGPTPVAERFTGMPLPISVETATDRPGSTSVLLNPFGLYGRERSWSTLPPGKSTVHAFLVARADALVGPTGPVDAADLVVAAAPVVVEIEPA